MKTLRAIFSGAIVAMLSLQFLAVPSAMAGDTNPTSRLVEVGGDTTVGNRGTLGDTLAGIIRTGLGLLGIILVILIMYAGYLWMTAQGNEEQVTKAKNIIKNAVIGMLLTFLAYAITGFVIKAITTTQG